MAGGRTHVAEQRILDALGTGRIRRFRIQRRVYERDTRLDVDAARIALDRHHRSELALLVDAPPPG
jgi:hypothetical protein